MRSLGEFFGHVARGFSTPVRRDRTTVVRREVEERAAPGEPGRTVVLRRTTIEEVEVRPDTAPRE